MRWPRVATPAACRIVRKIIQEAHPEPLHTQTIYALSQTVKLTEEEERAKAESHLSRRTSIAMPPNPSHPIRSVRYLKTVVLKDLIDRNEIVKVIHERPATEQELVGATSIKPLTPSQRKNRGAAGSGRRPIIPQGQLVKEWVGRIKDPETVELERLVEDRHLRVIDLGKQRESEARRRLLEDKQNRYFLTAAQRKLSSPMASQERKSRAK